MVDVVTLVTQNGKKCYKQKTELSHCYIYIFIICNIYIYSHICKIRILHSVQLRFYFCKFKLCLYFSIYRRTQIALLRYTRVKSLFYGPKVLFIKGLRRPRLVTFFGNLRYKRYKGVTNTRKCLIIKCNIFFTALRVRIFTRVCMWGVRARVGSFLFCY